jgi:Protein of unknown function (DUF4099)/Protein of unknown function (DUF3945)
MEQEKNEKDVLIAKDERSGKVGLVSGVKEDGSPQITDGKQSNGQDFLHFDRGGNMLDNFMVNFLRQYKDPKHFGFYRIAAEGVENVLTVVKDLLKDPQTNKETLDQYRIDTGKYEQKVKEQSSEQGQPISQTEQNKHTYQPIDESRIDWQQLEERWGINRQGLEASGDLKKMLNYGKSGLVTVSPKFGEERFETEARLSLRTLPDGGIQLVPHLIRKEPQLDKEFRGYTFSSDDKENLQKTGNMGRIAQLTDKDTGETTPVYISIDRLTNNIVFIPVSKVRIPDKIGDTVLSDQEKRELRAGHPVRDKEIVLTSGKKFTTTLQVNVEQRGVEFVPRHLQQNRESTQKQTGNYFQWMDSNGNIRAPKTFGGVALTPEQQTDYTAGKPILVKDMVRDKQGEPFTAYIKFNREESRPKYYPSNPDISQAKQVTPASENRTQVAVNSEGKTNDATRRIGEPLKSGQAAPINQEQQQRQVKAIQKKPKRVGA